MIDTDSSGTITFDELKDGLKRVGSELMESEIQDLMDAVSSFCGRLIHLFMQELNLIQWGCPSESVLGPQIGTFRKINKKSNPIGKNQTVTCSSHELN